MNKVPFTMFGKTRMVPHVTYTNGKEDSPPRDKWDDEYWIERSEDGYGIPSASRNKTILVVNREDFIRAELDE